MVKKSITIIGGGAAALMCAAIIDHHKYNVTIYEKNKALGRKFLVAGDGGFNLTHAQPMEQFVQQYTPVSFLNNCLKSFTNEHFIQWLQLIGISTFVGTSKRVYPIKNIKPIEVLNAILQVLKSKNVIIKTKMEFTKCISSNQVQFNNDLIVNTDIVVFALGGGSWQVTGTNHNWLPIFNNFGIKTNPFLPSNCGYYINWDTKFINNNEGMPLKNIAIHCDNFSKKGEIVITKFGMEGGAIYALSPFIRKQLIQNNKANICIDLKPTLTLESIVSKLKVNHSKSLTEVIKKELHLNNVAVALLKSIVKKEDFHNINIVANAIKCLPLTIVGFGELDKAISTVGGVDLSQVNEHFDLKSVPNYYVIGEMLDWDAPTGGYLLQACVSMGYYVANHLNGLLK